MGTLPVYSNWSMKNRYNSYKSGSHGKRIIKTFIRNGREYQLHATKGWRSYRIGKQEN